MTEGLSSADVRHDSGLILILFQLAQGALPLPGVAQEQLFQLVCVMSQGGWLAGSSHVAPRAGIFAGQVCRLSKL